MKRKRAILLLHGFSLLCLNCYTTEAGIDFEAAPAPSNKIFHYDNTRRTWAQAKTYCETHNPVAMTLASLDEAGAGSNEYTFLDGKYSAGNFSGWYWTAARDYRLIESFNWARPPSPIDPTAFGPRLEYAGVDSCLALYVKPGAGNSHGIVQPCDAANGLTLCMR